MISDVLWAYATVVAFTVGLAVVSHDMTLGFVIMAGALVSGVLFLTRVTL